MVGEEETKSGPGNGDEVGVINKPAFHLIWLSAFGPALNKGKAKSTSRHLCPSQLYKQPRLQGKWLRPLSPLSCQCISIHSHVVAASLP